MTLTFNTATLKSRTVQTTINLARTAAKAVSGILPKLKAFAGFLFTQVVNFFHLSFSSLWDVFVNAYFAIKFFNFNATDEELNKLMEMNNQRIVSLAASALGQQLGYGAVRLANLWVGKFIGNKSAQYAQTQKIPVLNAEIGIALAETQNLELANSVRNFLRSTVSHQLSNAFISALLTARKNHWFGLNPITTTQKNGSINHKIEEFEQELPKFWQQPAQQFITGLEMGIINAGYIVAFKIDDHIAAMRHASRFNGPQKVVELVTEKGSDEKLVFAGTQDDVIESLQQATQEDIPLLKNKDIGAFLGEVQDEQISLKNQLRKLTFTFCEYPRPPFRRKGILGKRTTISVPDARIGLSWSQLKAAATPYQSGDYFVKVKLANGREMEGWFDSPGEGQTVLTRLAALSTVAIRPETFRFSHQGSGGVSRGIHEMFPQKVAVLYPKRSNGNNLGIKGVPVTLSLWQVDEPPNLPRLP